MLKAEDVKVEEVPLIKDVDYPSFDNANYEVSIDQNNHYQAVSTAVEDDVVLGQIRGSMSSNDNHQSLESNEPLLNCAITEQLPTESMTAVEDRADRGTTSNPRI